VRRLSLPVAWRTLKRLVRAVPCWGTKLFDPAYYRRCNPGIVAARIVPWAHFVVAGAYEGRSPHPLFDAAFYLQKYPDVAAINANPLFHYLKHGAQERRSPHRLFEPDYYLSRCPQARRREADPLIHFLQSRGGDCCEPNPLFDCQFYLRHHPEAEGTNPLLHYLLHKPDRSSEKRLILLHYHFFKNAGTTIEGILTRSFGNNYFRLDTPDPNGSLTHAELFSFLAANPSAQAISSHQLRHPVPQAPGLALFDLCFLRRPLDRVRSMYDYFREYPDPGDPISDLANNWSVGEYLARLVEHYPHAVNDVQVRRLTNCETDHRPNELDLEYATTVMLKTSFLGVVDCFDESVIAGEHFLRPVFPSLDCDYLPANITNGMNGTVDERVHGLRDACGSHVYEQLQRLNVLDRELVARARAEVMRRFRIIPDHAARLQILKNEVQTRIARRRALSSVRMEHAQSR